jgi:hypothetical protein
MAKTLLNTLAIATLSAVLGVSAIEAKPAEAARITYEFQTSTDAMGRFSYDESTETRSELQDSRGTIIVDQSYLIDSIEFFFNNKVYTQADTLEGIDWRIYSYLGGELGDIGYQLFWRTADFLFQPVTYRDQFAFTSFHPQEGYNTSVSFSRVTEPEPPASVPEPGTTAGLSLLGLSLLWKRKGKTPA